MSPEPRLSETIDKLGLLFNSVSEGSFQTASELRADLEKKAKLAKAASEELFAKSPLPDIGGELWKELWEAARLYSDTVAYPRRPFPETGESDLCVLCQQPLDEEAIARRHTFEEFVKGTTKGEHRCVALAAFLAELVTANDYSGIVFDDPVSSLDHLYRGNVDLSCFRSVRSALLSHLSFESDRAFPAQC